MDREMHSSKKGRNSRHQLDDVEVVWRFFARAPTE